MDPTSFFTDFKDTKKYFFHIFFLQLANRHIICSLHIYEKREGSGAGSPTLVPQIWLLDPHTDPEKP
jgi:hypothetical protein